MAGYTNEQVGHSLAEYLARTARRFHIQKAILFGSRAREDHLFESDVDLVLISPDFRDMPFRARLAAALEGWTADVDLEVLCYTPEEFERKRQDPGIVQQAAREGVDLALP
jgi:predicted nucleotidyltransferase